MYSVIVNSTESWEERSVLALTLSQIVTTYGQCVDNLGSTVGGISGRYQHVCSIVL